MSNDPLMRYGSVKGAVDALLGDIETDEDRKAQKADSDRVAKEARDARKAEIDKMVGRAHAMAKVVFDGIATSFTAKEKVATVQSAKEHTRTSFTDDDKRLSSLVSISIPLPDTKTGKRFGEVSLWRVTNNEGASVALYAFPDINDRNTRTRVDEFDTMKIEFTDQSIGEMIAKALEILRQPTR